MKNREKGFTLVELIVVLVILAILASILVPALLGHIDRAKQEKGVQKVHELQVAATAALVEYYGLYKGAESAFKNNTYAIDGNKKNNLYGHDVTNFTFARIQDTNNVYKDESNKAPEASAQIAKMMLRYLESNYGDKDKAYTFKSYNLSPFNMTAKTIADKGAEGLVVIFDTNYKIQMIQYSDLDGYLYTYSAKKKDITVEYNGKFVKKN